MRSYTPLRYPGGKAKLYNFAVDLIDKNFKEKPEYIEAFVGGAGLAMKLLLNNKVSKIYINDLDDYIYSFWYSVLNNTNEFIDLIKTTPVNITEWKNQKDIYLNNKSTTLEKGFALFYLNRTNRSGIIKAGPIGGYNQAGNYKIDCRFNKNNLIQIIENIAAKKDKIILANMDGKDFVKLYDKKSSNSLIYLDPPYVLKGKELYHNSFLHNDHITLYNSIKALKNAWFVTYDDHKLIKEIYKDFRLEKFEINYTVQTKRVAKEVAIFSPKLKNSTAIYI